ncbi:FMN-binding negative transcriptional regulator [Niveispirillum irakense]|uniref:FMN-binding negative transcriptional regulator n=1 Tax=Niveispirillum irakense TaxID=34011 RepID=UPI000408791F|nr:FMN-binding negative transcriptional regulator [Niveispirillum irakense]
MYVPPQYRAMDPAAIIHRYPFAQFITGGGDAPLMATSTPICFERDGDETRLVGHLSRGNPQAATLEEGMPILAIFAGPHAYISPAWYREKPEVPTWNYVTAQVRGRLTPIDDGEGQLAVLRRTAAVAEQGARDPWRLEKAPEGRVDFLLPMIRSFRIHVEAIEGATKLGQKHPVGDRMRVICALTAKGGGTETDLARLMADAI